MKEKRQSSSSISEDENDNLTLKEDSFSCSQSEAGEEVPDLCIEGSPYVINDLKSSGVTINLTIETLLGTAYEVQISSNTSVGFLKTKLQRSEGIPKQYLHLVYKGKLKYFSSYYYYCKTTLSLILKTF